MPAKIKWTQELEDAICAAISVTPKGLEHICKAHADFPCADQIYKHRHDNQEFSEKYARAKANQCMVLADQIIDISDDSAHDLIETEDGEEVNREVIERARIRIDARKWLAGKLAPKIFGDRLGISAPDGGPVAIKRVVVDV